MIRILGIDPGSQRTGVGIIDVDDTGKLPFGLGITLGGLASPHDGTVSVEETQLPGIADHRTVATSHTGMLLSSEVADLTIEFLRDGRFASVQG